MISAGNAANGDVGPVRAALVRPARPRALIPAPSYCTPSYYAPSYCTPSSSHTPLPLTPSVYSRPPTSLRPYTHARPFPIAHFVNSVAQLFQEAQADTGCHRKNALAVRKHFKLRPADDVNADLIQCINKVRP